jgi:hypothetical protein
LFLRFARRRAADAVPHNRIGFFFRASRACRAKQKIGWTFKNVQPIFLSTSSQSPAFKAREFTGAHFVPATCRNAAHSVFYKIIA